MFFRHPCCLQKFIWRLLYGNWSPISKFGPQFAILYAQPTTRDESEKWGPNWRWTRDDFINFFNFWKTINNLSNTFSFSTWNRFWFSFFCLSDLKKVFLGGTNVIYWFHSGFAILLGYNGTWRNILNVWLY